MSLAVYRQYLQNIGKCLQGYQVPNIPVDASFLDLVGFIRDLDEMTYIDHFLSSQGQPSYFLRTYDFLHHSYASSILERLRNKEFSTELRDEFLANLGALADPGYFPPSHTESVPSSFSEIQSDFSEQFAPLLEAHASDDEESIEPFDYNDPNYEEPDPNEDDDLSDFEGDEDELDVGYSDEDDLSDFEGDDDELDFNDDEDDFEVVDDSEDDALSDFEGDEEDDDLSDFEGDEEDDDLSDFEGAEDDDLADFEGDEDDDLADFEGDEDSDFEVVDEEEDDLSDFEGDDDDFEVVYEEEDDLSDFEGDEDDLSDFEGDEDELDDYQEEDEDDLSDFEGDEDDDDLSDFEGDEDDDFPPEDEDDDLSDFEDDDTDDFEDRNYFEDMKRPESDNFIDPDDLESDFNEIPKQPSTSSRLNEFSKFPSEGNVHSSSSSNTLGTKSSTQKKTSSLDDTLANAIYKLERKMTGGAVKGVQKVVGFSKRAKESLRGMVVSDEEET